MRGSVYLARTCLVWWGSDLIVWQSFGAKAVLVVRVPRAGWAQHLVPQAKRDIPKEDAIAG